ncbi:hypothetical protein D3C72_2338670 [compost metagenome]
MVEPLEPLEVPLGLVVLVAPDVPVDVPEPGVPLRLRLCSDTEPEPDSDPAPLVLPVAVQPARMPSIASRAVPMRNVVFMFSSI